MTQAKICAVDGCDRPRGGKYRHCWTHVSRRHNGEADWATRPVDERRRQPSSRPRQVGVGPCVIQGCGGVINARGLCWRHYSRWRNGGPIDAPAAPHNRSAKSVAAEERMERRLTEQRRAEMENPVAAKDFAWDRPNSWVDW